MRASCSVCGKDGAVTLEDARLSLYKCLSCSHRFKDIPKEEEEHFSEEYYREAHRNWFENPDVALFNRARRAISKRKKEARLRLLDVGCGKGDFLKYLRGKDPDLELHGIDLTENSHEGIHFIKGDFLKDGLETIFDVVTSFAVIEHINNPRLFIEKIRGVLAPGGLALITTINNEGLLFKLTRVFKKGGAGQAYSRLYGHHNLQFFSNGSLRKIMEMSGFRVIGQRNHNHPLKAVDLPEAGAIVTGLYKISLLLLFLATSVLGGGLLQTIICEKR